MQPPRRLRMMPDAIRLYLLLDEIAVRILDVRPRIADQLFRAALSFVLNLEEGSYEFSAAEKTRFYRISYRSLAECRVVLDLIGELRILPAALIQEAGRQLERLSPQVFNLIKRRKTTGAEAKTAAPSIRPAAGLPPQASPRQATQRAKRASPS